MKISFEEFLVRKSKLKPRTKVKILSASMEPYIYTGEFIECTPKNIDDISAGEAIIFWREDKLICHFLLKKICINDKNFLETKGINSSKKDPLVPEEYYFAVVTSPTISSFKRRLFTFFNRLVNKS